MRITNLKIDSFNIIQFNIEVETGLLLKGLKMQVRLDTELDKPNSWSLGFVSTSGDTWIGFSVNFGNKIKEFVLGEILDVLTKLKEYA